MERGEKVEKNPIDNIEKLIKNKGMEFRSFNKLEFREMELLYVGLIRQG